MIKKTMFIVFCLVSKFLSAEDGQPAQKPSQIGKYQLVYGPMLSGAHYLYLIDTENGTIWKGDEVKGWSGNTCTWEQISSPVSE